jgi:DNA-binding transcriptional MerR regulator
VPVSIEQLAVELAATPREIRACAWQLRRHASSLGLRDPEFVTEELADQIRRHLPVHRAAIEHRRRSERQRSERLLTANELAAELQVSPATIRQWKSRNYLQPADQKGRQNLYRFGDVLRVSAEVRRRTKTAPEIEWRLERVWDRVVTTRQAAGLINVSSSAIRMWVKRGHLTPVERRNHRMLFVVRDVVAAARRHT